MTESVRIINYKNRNLYLRTFLPEGAPKAILQLNHGLAEHGERYRDFAVYLTQHGYGIYVHDHPGHGKTAENAENAGHLPWKTGWNLMLNCINQINKTIRNDFPQIPVFIMGHSMGSLLARHYNISYPMYFSGMIISGTTNPGIINLQFNLLLIKLLKLFSSTTKKIKWLNNKFYSDFNKTIKNPNTRYDWLSNDTDQVNRYNNDPMCGFDLSLGFYKTLLIGSIRMLSAEKNIKIRKSFPILIFSGKQDPVGNFGKDPLILQKKFLKQGYMNAELLLTDGRHELLNETDKEKNFSIIVKWMSVQLSRKTNIGI
jgi:alpha-beta hydrolase superfamily lysophospholipase